MKFRAFLPAVIAATCILAPSAAQAFTFQIGPNSCSSESGDASAFQLDSSGCFNNSQPTGASAQLKFSFTQGSEGNVLLDLDIINNTGKITDSAGNTELFGDGATEATLNALAFDFRSIALGSLQSYDPLGSSFTRSSDNIGAQPFSNNPNYDVGNFEIGIWAEREGNGRNNNGNPNENPFQGNNPQNGLTAGEQTQVQFSFAPSTAGTSLAASDFAQAFEQEIRSGNLNVAARFQQVNAGAGSDTLLGGRVTNGDRPTQVPEPAAVGALGLTAAGLGLLKKKQSAEAGDQDASA